MAHNTSYCTKLKLTTHHYIRHVTLLEGTLGACCHMPKMIRQSMIRQYTKIRFPKVIDSKQKYTQF